MSIRPIKRVLQSQPTIEGAGVRLRRAFGFGDTKTSILSFCSTTFAMRTRGFTWRVSLAPASRHRNHHLRPRGDGETMVTASGNKGPLGAGDGSG